MKDISIDKINSLIIQKESKIDTFQVWFPRKLTEYESDTLESLCMGEFMKPSNKSMKFRKKWKSRRILHRPTSDAFDYIHELFSKDILINRVDISLDLTTESRKDAYKVKEFIDNHIVHLWHGKQTINWQKDTRYTAKRKAGKVVVTYADKNLKLTRIPCCHIEIRFTGAGRIRNMGIYDSIKLKDFNHVEFWKNNLLLKDINVEKLGKLFLKLSHAKKPHVKIYSKNIKINWFTRVGTILCRNAAKHNYPIVSTQELIDYYKDRNAMIQKSLIKIDNSTLLPGHTHII